MSRLFDRPSVSADEIEQIEREILDVLPNISFHRANYHAIENVSRYFENNNLVLQFTDNLLNTVYDKFIHPARTYGYYFGDMPAAERPGIFRTSSACQYHGNDERFRNACCIILGAIDTERQKRNAPTYSNSVS